MQWRFKLMPNLHTWNVSFNFLLSYLFKLCHLLSLPPSPHLCCKPSLLCVYDGAMVFSSAQTEEKGYHRLTPDQPVGLRHAHCYLTLENVIKVLQYYTTPPIIIWIILYRTQMVKWSSYIVTIIHMTPATSPNPTFTGCLTPYSVPLGSMTNCRQAACLLCWKWHYTIMML